MIMHEQCRNAGAQPADYHSSKGFLLLVQGLGGDNTLHAAVVQIWRCL